MATSTTTITTIKFLAGVWNFIAILASTFILAYCFELVKTEYMPFGWGLAVLNLFLFKAFYQSQAEIDASIAEFNSKQAA